MPIKNHILPILIFAVLLQPELSAQDVSTDPDQELEAVATAISQIETWLGEAASNRSSLEQELRTANQEIGRLENEISSNREAIANNQQRIDALQAEIDSLNARKSAQQTLVAEAVRNSYQLGRESPLKLLLNQQDPTRSARQIQYFNYLNTARAEKIAEFQDIVAALAASQTELNTLTSQLEQQEQILQTQLASLSERTQERNQVLAALTREMSERSDELEQLQQDREHLEQLIEEIRQAIVNIPAPEQLMPFAEARGQLPWPLPGRRLNSFGASYSDGNLQRQGIILESATGDPVRAIHPGRVVFSDWLRGSGFLLVIDHGNNYMSLYAHNQQLLKQAGDWANRGEQIASAGPDAGTGVPGIYFEIRHNGQAQDPVNWCSSR